MNTTESQITQYDSQIDSALALGLKCILMSPEDLRFRTDYTEVDSFRLNLIDGLMGQPKLVISELETNVEKLTHEESGSDFVLNALEVLNGEIIPESLLASRTLASNGEDNQIIKIETLEGKINTKALSGELGNSVLKIILCELIISNNRSDDDNIMRFLRTNVPVVVLEDLKDEFKNPQELDELQKYEEQLSKKINEIATQFKYQDWRELLSSATAVILQSATDLSKSARTVKNYKKKTSHKINEILLELSTDVGKVVVGGVGPNYYHGNPILIIDLGGDDIYEIGHDSTVSSQIIIDLNGNDIYKAQTDFALGSGFFGAGILIDEEGDDTYLGKNFSLGSGLFGVGILIDKKGNDKYFGDTYTQGAGGWGIGILADLEGSDTYNGALYSQGFGFVAGCGMLIDRSGNDNYFAGGKYKDILRYKDHYLSLSQGFAYGIRPYMSGGIGLLFDYAGNDNYTADIFGQGSSYWWGWGGLYDGEGNDMYSCFQYGQGCGTHMTLGTLVDKSGDDIYRVNGVGQGCGHDYSAGILLDEAGNDSYYAGGLSQGAGNANGFGILIDKAGDDGYYVKDKSNSQGYGNPRREFGSVGLFIDMQGKDIYSGNGSEGAWWSLGSKWGVGVDLKERELAENFSVLAPNSREPGTLKARNIPAYHMADWERVAKYLNLPENDSLKKLVDSLFIVATAINVEHMDKVEPAKLTLREMKEKSIPYLVKKLNSRDAREIQSLIDILGKMPEATLPVVSVLKNLNNDDNWVVRNACRVLAELKDTVAVPFLIDILNHPDFQVRGYALTAIGNAKDTSAFGWIVLGLADSVEVVRKSAAYALGELGDERGVGYLVWCFGDRHYSVRMVAAEALGKIGERAVPKLKQRLANEENDSDRLLLLRALGMTESTKAYDILWKSYVEATWLERATIVEVLGELKNVQNAIRLNSVRQKEYHPLVQGKLDLALNKYRESK